MEDEIYFPEYELTPQQAFEDLFRPLPSEFHDAPPVLIENTLYKGAIMLIGGASKIGKSFLVAAMVKAFSLGSELLGFKFAKCERVLIVNSEMQCWEYDNRILEACESERRKVAEHVCIAHTDDRPTYTIKDVADNICESNYKPDVVIIDPIYPLFIGDENSNADAKITLAYLKAIASKTGAGVIYVHHYSKGAQDNKEARDRVSGAGTLGRNYSALWAITELAPDEEDMKEYPDGATVLRISTDFRSFKKSKGNKNSDFNAVLIKGKFIRDDEGAFNNTPTREAARRVANNPQKAQKAKRMEKVRKRVEQMLKETKGAPVPFAKVKQTTGTSLNTFKDYLVDMDEYQLVKLKLEGKGQAQNHVAWTTWQPPLDAEIVEDE